MKLKALISKCLARLLVVALSIFPMSVYPLSLSEYEIKAGFIFNFATYTHWPKEVGDTITLCVYGRNPFGQSLLDLKGKYIEKRRLKVSLVMHLEQLTACQIVFIAQSEHSHLDDVVDVLKGKHVLTLADMPGAVRKGVMINLLIEGGKVKFEVNLAEVKQHGMGISAKLLRMASEVVR